MTVFWALVLSMTIIVAPIESVVAGQFDINEGYSACLDKPEYAIGGSMAGDCFIDQSAELDLEIETMLARAAKKYCRAADRAAIASSQSAWIDYREGYCTLIANSPGNTGAWINGGACRLDLTQKRLESLFFLADHAHSWCRKMQLLTSVSHFGDPANLVRRDEKTGAGWSTRKDGDGHFLDVFGGQDSASTSIDITSCRYCSRGADCNDGVFMFSREDNTGNIDHSVAHLCTVESGGPRFDIVELTPSAPVRTSIGAARRIAWVIDDGRLRIMVDEDESALYWPNSKPDRQSHRP